MLQEKYATVEWLVRASWLLEMVTPMNIKFSTTENSSMSYNTFKIILPIHAIEMLKIKFQ